MANDPRVRPRGGRALTQAVARTTTCPIFNRLGSNLIEWRKTRPITYLKLTVIDDVLIVSFKEL